MARRLMRRRAARAEATVTAQTVILRRVHAFAPTTAPRRAAAHRLWVRASLAGSVQTWPSPAQGPSTGDALQMTEYYAYLETPVLCPVCGREFENTEGHIRVQIGKLERWYKIGEYIEWADDFERDQVAGLSPVYVFACDDDYSLWQCQACRTLFDSPAAIVESGRITRVCLMTEAQTRELFGLDRGFADIVGYDGSHCKWELIGDMVPKV
jgi:hypothetical protein